jgi:methionyl-tRNA formyltransferase
MKYVFFGTPEFAAVILEKLIGSGFVPAAVVCNPDRPAGRKKLITPPPVKSLIMQHEAWGIEILQPEKLDSSFMIRVSSFKPDLFIVASYAKIIPKVILETPRLGVIGVHPSILPEYRGSTPIQSVILEGEHETGVSLYLLDEKVDHGRILAGRKLLMGTGDTYEVLLRKLAALGGDLLAEILPKFLAGEVKPEPQDEAKATYTKKFTSEDAFVDPRELDLAESGGDAEKARLISRKILALNPEPGVWTLKDGKRTKLLEAEIRENRLVLKKIQREGEKPKAAR